MGNTGMDKVVDRIMECLDGVEYQTAEKIIFQVKEELASHAVIKRKPLLDSGNCKQGLVEWMDFCTRKLSPEEEANGDSFRVNHRGDNKWIYPAMALIVKLCRWIENKKKFRVILDYDPEWCFKVTFRRMTAAEEAFMESCKPTADELDKWKERPRQ